MIMIPQAVTCGRVCNFCLPKMIISTGVRFEKASGTNQQQVAEYEIELADIEKKLYSLEENWITDEISKEGYQVVHDLQEKILELEAAIQRNGMHITSSAKKIIDDNLHLLTDLPAIYERADTMQKREL